MKESLKLKGLCFIMSAVILGFFGTAGANDQPSRSRDYRHEVFQQLKSVQSNLDSLSTNHQLTPDQYQTESERVRQLKLQTHVDAQQQDTMTKDDRDTDMQLIQQISQEISQLVAANSAPAGTH